MKKIARDELPQIIIDELTKVEDCQGVTSISIYRRPESYAPNWSMGFINFGDADETICRRVLPEIIQRLQGQFELA